MISQLQLDMPAEAGYELRVAAQGMRGWHASEAGPEKIMVEGLRCDLGGMIYPGSLNGVYVGLVAHAPYMYGCLYHPDPAYHLSIYEVDLSGLSYAFDEDHQPRSHAVRVFHHIAPERLSIADPQQIVQVVMAMG